MKLLILEIGVFGSNFHLVLTKSKSTRKMFLMKLIKVMRFRVDSITLRLESRLESQD